jgi:hypothetical protein
MILDVFDFPCLAISEEYGASKSAGLEPLSPLGIHWQSNRCKNMSSSAQAKKATEEFIFFSYTATAVLNVFKFNFNLTSLTFACSSSLIIY